MHITQRTSSVLAYLLVAGIFSLSACIDAPVTGVEEEEAGIESLDDNQPRVAFNEVTSTKSPFAAKHLVSIAGVGANYGFVAAAQLCSSGDYPCTFTPVDAAAFNALTPAQLRAAYDVLIFSWVSSSTINADWTTRLVPYMNLGGGILFEDPGNVSDLAPGVITTFSPCSYSGDHTVIATVPGLTDGIVDGAFANNHFCFKSWDAALSPFLAQTFVPSITGLWGAFGAGCIVLTGPDQHYHGYSGSSWGSYYLDNQYNLLKNEVDFVSHGCGGAQSIVEVEIYIYSGMDIDIKPGGEPNSINCKNDKKVITVAILTTGGFDATTVDHTTVTFEGASEFHMDKKSGKSRRHEEDVDDDGDTDLVLHFRKGDTALNCVSTEGTLTGETFGDAVIGGTDAVRMIGG